MLLVVNAQFLPEMNSISKLKVRRNVCRDISSFRHVSTRKSWTWFAVNISFRITCWFVLARCLSEQNWKLTFFIIHFHFLSSFSTSSVGSSLPVPVSLSSYYEFSNAMRLAGSHRLINRWHNFFFILVSDWAAVLRLFRSGQGRSQGGGGSWGARDPPFVSLFVSRQPTIFRWQSGEYPLYDPVWPPLWKILATPLDQADCNAIYLCLSDRSVQKQKRG